MGPQLLTRELVGVACARIHIVIDLLGHLERRKQVVEGVTFSNQRFEPFWLICGACMERVACYSMMWIYSWSESAACRLAGPCELRKGHPWR